MEKIIFLGNKDEWCQKSLNEIRNLPYVKIINSALPCGGKTIKSKIVNIHYSKRINKYIKIPFKRIWYSYLCQSIHVGRADKIIVVFYDRSNLANDANFLAYIKHYFYNAKLVYMFTNIIRLSGAQENNFVGSLKTYYDRIFAFDPADSKKYEFAYNPLLYSKNDVVDRGENGSAFYVGRAKDRYSMLVKVFERLKELNISRDFHIFGVEEKDQKYADEISYNKLMTYQECLEHIVSSNCLVDIIQGESEGFTIKTCEAIYYNKLLITTNHKIKEMDFYDSRYILVIDSADEITDSFFTNAPSVKYKSSALEYFSAYKFVERLKNEFNY